MNQNQLSVNIYKEKAKCELPDIMFGNYTRQIEATESDSLLTQVLPLEA